MAAALIVSGALLCIAGLRSGGPGSPPQPPVAVESAPATPSQSRAPSGLPRSAPVRIAIPGIGVRAPVGALGLDARGALAVPPLSRVDEAGWYKYGPTPGEPGPAVIAGHVDSKTEPGVFYKLGALRPGEPIRAFREDGTAPRFRVHRIERVPKDDFPTDRVYGPTGRPELRLITCGGTLDRSSGHYTQNVIVYAHLV